MKAGTENRKKTIIAGAFGAVALVCILNLLGVFDSSSKNAPPPSAPVIKDATVAAPKTTTASLSNAAATNTRSNAPAAAGATVAPGVDATKLASASVGLNPTLDEAAMLRTENLVYSGSGRNIFSLTYVAPVEELKLPKTPSPRGPVVPVAPVAPPPPPTCPPTCPPINLKFFGVVKARDGRTQAFFLAGDDVYLAREGDIVSRKYKIDSIGPNSARVEDLQNNNTQSIPLQQQ